MDVGRVRKYRVRFAVREEESGRYTIKLREFQSLRGAAEFARDLPSREDFLGIQAVDYGDLTEQECHAFALFTDGKIRLERVSKKLKIDP